MEVGQALDNPTLEDHIGILALNPFECTVQIIVAGTFVRFEQEEIFINQDGKNVDWQNQLKEEI